MFILFIGGGSSPLLGISSDVQYQNVTNMDDLNNYHNTRQVIENTSVTHEYEFVEDKLNHTTMDVVDRYYTPENFWNKENDKENDTYDYVDIKNSNDSIAKSAEIYPAATLNFSVKEMELDN
eukprot:Pgem_evm2s8617